MEDNKIWGPGRWESIHMTAAWCDSNGITGLFGAWMIQTAQTLSCENCVKHAMTYIQENRPDLCPEGYLYWSWKFHNFVNARLSKEEFPWTEAASRWIDGNHVVCTDC